MSIASCLKSQLPGEVCLTTSENSQYGQPDMLLHGIQSVKDNTMSYRHPLFSNPQWLKVHDSPEMDRFKMNQGLQLKLQMERKIASRNLRLPCLASSDLMYTTLTGDNETISFDDIYNNGEDRDRNINVHLALERHPDHL